MKATHEYMLGAAEELATVLAAAAEESEELRRPTDECIKALRESGLVKMLIPAVYGGHQLDLDTFAEVGYILGQADASLAWISMFYIQHNWLLCQFPEEVQKPIFQDNEYVLMPGALGPTVKAQKEGDSYRLSGRFSWMSGIMHGDYVFMAAMSQNKDGTPEPRCFITTIDQGTVDDVWFMDGMKATGSNDFVVEDLVIPERESALHARMGHPEGYGAKVHPDYPLCQTPMMPILQLTSGIPALGQAKASLERFKSTLPTRILVPSGMKQSDSAAARLRLARIEISMRELELLMRDTVQEIMQYRWDGSLEQRASWVARLAHVIQGSRQIVDSITNVSGASAHKLSHPQQRALRDVNTIACHPVFDLEAKCEVYGQALLDLLPPHGPHMAAI